MLRKLLLGMSLLAGLAGCTSAGSEEGDEVDLGFFDGKADGVPLRESAVTVSPGSIKRFRVRAVEFRAVLVQTGTPPMEAQISAKYTSTDEYSEPGTQPSVIAQHDTATHYWTVRVANLGSSTLRGTLRILPIEMEPETTLPRLDDAVQYENEWCVYQDRIPYVQSVRWTHPQIQAAMRAMLPGHRSSFTFTEWRVPYGLESETSGTTTERAQKTVRNWMRVLCGEHRDYPEMLARKLELLGARHVMAGPEEMSDVDTSSSLFAQLTYPAYEKLVGVMRTMHAPRQAARPGDRDGYHYGFGASGHSSQRVDHSVPPWTHCEMKFVFERYLGADAPSWVDATQYESDFAAYRATCTEEDLAWMYNFRGHVNFQPLWLESNAFVFNSRRARGAETSRADRTHYQHPFASRYTRARAALGTYLFYPDTHHDEMIQAAENGGGPILYITDQDTDRNGLADYRIFPSDPGCGDQGVGLPVPSQNCNMVSWEEAWHTRNTTGHASGWDPQWLARADMGFLATFTTFEARMGRLNAALDRHTNWGPTGYYMLDASDTGDTSPRFYGAYSPIVAASYDVSASDFFVRRDYPTTDSFELGRAKWLFVMRFPTAAYYDEQMMREGKPIDFDVHYFNETSLSNDFYRERALDRFGWVPMEHMHANVYLTYGARGEEPPALVDVPPPPGS